MPIASPKGRYYRCLPDDITELWLHNCKGGVMVPTVFKLTHSIELLEIIFSHTSHIYI